MNDDPEKQNSRRLPSDLRVPPWLVKVRDLLKENHPELWTWFRSDGQAAARDESVRLDLLKSTVRIDPGSGPEAVSIYKLANDAASKLNLDVPITIYQAKQTGQFNASISTETKQAHIVLQGNPGKKLNDDELTAVFGHELGHLLLWTLEDGEFLVAASILLAMGQDPEASAIHLETLRLFSQYTEIFCDRAAMIAQGNLQPVVSSLIKIETGLTTVSVDDYLKQANEIFSLDSDEPASSTGTRSIQGGTHPELYIRTRALDLWRETMSGDSGDDPEGQLREGRDFCELQIGRMVRGRLSLESMDLCGQIEARQLTREIFDILLDPEWMQCEATFAHARMFFPDYKVRKPVPKLVSEKVSGLGKDMPEYIRFLMLDFVTADRELMEPALAHVMDVADSFNMKSEFVTLARKELRLRKKQLEQIEKDASGLMKQAIKKQARSANE